MSLSIAAMMSADYGVMGDILRLRAQENPGHQAIIMDTGETVTYGQFDALVDVQHHLLVGHHRHAQGHRPAARMRWGISSRRQAAIASA
jgi:hypothetical protein